MSAVSLVDNRKRKVVVLRNGVVGAWWEDDGGGPAWLPIKSWVFCRLPRMTVIASWVDIITLAMADILSLPQIQSRTFASPSRDACLQAAPRLTERTDHKAVKMVPVAAAHVVGPTEEAGPASGDSDAGTPSRSDIIALDVINGVACQSLKAAAKDLLDASD
jgi:hypothetical protein